MGSSDRVFIRTNSGMHHIFSVTVRGRYSTDVWRANRQCHQLFIIWNPKILSVRLYGQTDQCNNEARRCLRSHCDSFQSDLAGDQGKGSKAIVKKMKPLWETEGGPRTDGCLICEWAMQPFAVRCSLSKTGQRRLEFGPFLHWQNVFKQRKWIHISHDNRRTITDSGISLLLRLWQDEPLLPPSCGQMSACSSLRFTTQPAWLIISYMEVWALLRLGDYD